MKCPKCEKEIEEVNVISSCWQKATLRGNKIDEYGSVEDILDTIKIECPECLENISKFVRY